MLRSGRRAPADLAALESVAQVTRWTAGSSLKANLERERSGSELWLAFAALALGVAATETVLGNRWSRSR